MILRHIRKTIYNSLQYYQTVQYKFSKKNNGFEKFNKNAKKSQSENMKSEETKESINEIVNQKKMDDKYSSGQNSGFSRFSKKEDKSKQNQGEKKENKFPESADQYFSALENQKEKLMKQSEKDANFSDRSFQKFSMKKQKKDFKKETPTKQSFQDKEQQQSNINSNQSQFMQENADSQIEREHSERKVTEEEGKDIPNQKIRREEQQNSQMNFQPSQGQNEELQKQELEQTPEEKQKQQRLKKYLYFRQRLAYFKNKERERIRRNNSLFRFLGRIEHKRESGSKQIQRMESQLRKRNPRLYSIYLILKNMKLIIIIGLLMFLLGLKKTQLSEQIESEQLILLIKQGTITLVQLYDVEDETGSELGHKEIKYVVAEDDSGRSYQCVSNDDFENFLRKLISEINNQSILATGAPKIYLEENKKRKNPNFVSLIRTALSIGLLFMIFSSIATRRGKQGGMGGGGGADLQFGGSKSKRFKKEVNVRFEQVMGMQKAKEQIVQFIDFLKNPGKYNRLGAKIPRGALLTGPPGTGKTMIAKACAGESNVPFFSISGSQFMEMFVGVGAQRVRDLFKEAKQNSPSIIFIDQIDAIGKKRAAGLGGGNDERDNTLNQMLVEMDGFGTNSNVIVFAATNQKEVLDPALTRPGRFDRLIEVDLPDIEGRREIFMVHLKPILLDDDIEVGEYAKRMATLTPGFSGADIKNLCNQAAIIAARGEKRFVSLHDFEMATERIIGGVEKKSALITPETQKTVAYHECGHGVASWFLEGANPLLKLTIIPRSKGALGFAQYLPHEHQVSTRKQLEDQICVILGGRISQQIFFNKISTGALDDLQKAYKFAKAIVAQYGMSDQLGWLSFEESQYAKHYSHQTEKNIDREIMKIIKECTQRTRNLLNEKKSLVENLALKLLQKQTIDQKTIAEILGERPFKPSKQYEEYLSEKIKNIPQEVNFKSKCSQII